MKKIATIFPFVFSIYVGIIPVARAGSNSTHSGNNPKTCAIGALNGVLSPVENIITGDGEFSGNFPKSMSSATSDGGVPGKFVTLCNIDPSRIIIEVGGVIVPPGQSGYTVKFTLSSASVGVYPAPMLITYDSSVSAASNQIHFALSDTPKQLAVSAKITAESSKILIGSNIPNSYSVPFTATLTP